MDRRSFLIGAGAAGTLALGTAAGYWRWQEITPHIYTPGQAEGHFLRDRKSLPAPSEEINTDVVILGSGIAGLTAAWKLNKEGHRNFVVIDGPQAYGNAAGGRFGDLAYPTGAHYLPLPSMESVHVRELLHDLGIIQKNPMARRPYYDERCILHAPEDRLLYKGRWQEGIIPREGVQRWEIEQQDRFFKEVERIRSLRGSDGKRLFAIPLVLSSADPAWRALDRLSFEEWLAQQGYNAPTLLWHINYCCRDDYGAEFDQVSAWAGLHYFCSRGGEAENAHASAWLTWPGGLDVIASGMNKAAGNHRRTGTAMSLRKTANGVEALCLELNANGVRSFTVKARRAICAMPLFVAARIITDMSGFGFDAKRDLPPYAPWMVANFLVKELPGERPQAPLSWDNVVYQGKGLGYVVSTHQDIRVTPPRETVFTAYIALTGQSPTEARRWLVAAAPDELLDLAASDLTAAYGIQFGRYVQRADITLRGHAMAIPHIGFLSTKGMQALRDADGPLLFAHADLSGLSVFEEAAWWGYQAALKVLRG
ncbi:MAG: NAD(P)-binding protein [Burkholderiales bacterium]|nr:NAD(P)-binding protein [Burkholderiales bacterium]